MVHRQTVYFPVFYLIALGERWAPAITETYGELVVLEVGVVTEPCGTHYWIGGSTNVTLKPGSVVTVPYGQYIPDDSGSREAKYLCLFHN